MFGLVLRLVLGAVILLAGRNLFWLVIAAIGFFVGVEFASIGMAGYSTVLILAVGLAAGLIGALLAIVFQRVGFALAGFYAAVFVTLVYATKLGFVGVSPVVLLVIGLAAALLVALLTDWTIIVLSAVAGAVAITSVFALPPAVDVICSLGLAALGVAVQGSTLRRRRVA
jgi:hypothetical protein